MKDLIERLEKATGPDRVLDYDIAMWLNRPFGAWDSFQKYDAAFPTYTRRDAPAYTSSIDAALTLVPKGKSWGVGSIMFDETPPRRAFAANCRREGYIGPETPAYDALGATPAVALTIAALRARQRSPAKNETEVRQSKKTDVM